MLADVGYSNERDLSVLEARGGYVAPGRESKRMVNRNPHGSADPHTRTRRRMVEKLATPTTREYYAQRKWLRGWEVLGFRRFSVRDPDKARGGLGVCVSGESSVCNRFRQCEGTCSPVRRSRNHRASCRTPRILSHALRANRSVPAIMSVHEFSPSVRSRVLSYLSATQTHRTRKAHQRPAERILAR